MITDELIDQLMAILSRAGLTDDSVAALRDAFPALHFTHCLDDDIGAGIEPARKAERFNLYLVDGRSHCMTFTADVEAATGLVFASVEDCC
jgi:hypothetical protein